MASAIASRPTVDPRYVLVPAAASSDRAALVCAGFVSRLAAGAIDIVVLAAIIALANWFLVTVEDMLRPWSTAELRRYLVAATPFIILGYFVAFWRLSGQTIGKWFLGLRVVSADGGRVSLTRAVIRVFGYLLSALPLYAGYLQILVDPQRRALHDRLSRTAVVYADVDSNGR